VISKQSLLIHLALLGVAGALSLRAITKDEDESQEKHQVELWSGSAEAVQRIEFHAKKRDVVLEGQSDAHGRYFIATVDREKPKPMKNPHGPQEPDAGAPKEPEVVERETQRFVGVREANELAESLAKLRAERALGKLDASRFEEFGFGEDSEATLKVNVGGAIHELVIGGKTPGGNDVYVRDAKSAEGYVVAGNFAQKLESAESSLIARDFYSFEPEKVGKVVIKAGEAQRELVPVKDKKGFWANPSDATAKDETASNWMTKLERLRVGDYVEKPSSEPAPVARVEYFGSDGKSLGALELFSQTAPGEDKPTYLGRSADSRWFGTVLSSVAEQLMQDLPSILNP
jgi:hypothetical protein